MGQILSTLWGLFATTGTIILCLFVGFFVMGCFAALWKSVQSRVAKIWSSPRDTNDVTNPQEEYLEQQEENCMYEHQCQVHERFCILSVHDGHQVLTIFKRRRGFLFCAVFKQQNLRTMLRTLHHQPIVIPISMTAKWRLQKSYPLIN